MYYGVDENGDIIFSTSSDILPDNYQDIFPETVSGSDLDVSFDDPIYFDDPFGSFDEDHFIELLAAIPGYAVYPNTAAVSVFQDVLNGVSGRFGYIIISGSDTYTTYLYYSRFYYVSGSTVTLSSPVTRCTYYQYRPSSSSSFYYTYSVDIVGDISFTPTNQLVYTNLLEGYPDVVSYKSHESFYLLFLIALAVVFIFVVSLGSKFLTGIDRRK